MANKKNLANAELNAGITSSATSFAVKAGQGARLPATPFFATITPLGVLSTPDNSEIVSVTTVATDTLTVVRAQKSSTAYAFVAGSIISNGIYAEDMDMGATIDAATSKTTPVDADELGLADSAASFAFKKLTWANIKATLKTYFDTLYQPLDATLTALAGLATGASKIPYSTGTDTFGQLDLSTSTSLGTSDTTLSSQKAVKAYVDAINPQYSTSEVDTGKKWTDGSTIYRKVINTTMTVGVGTNTVSTGITGGTSTFKYISITGGINLGSSTATTAQTFMYREAAGNWISLTSTSSTTLSFTSSFGWGTTAVIAILEYVK